MRNPFKKHIDTAETAKKAMYIDRPIDAATKTAMELNIGVPLAADVDQSRFARDERSTPGFHLNNINDIIASLETTRDHIAESIGFEETRHHEEMNRLEIHRDNVSKSISGYMAARAVLTGVNPTSEALYSQQIGRALRPPMPSDRVKIGDFVDLEGKQYQIVPKNTAEARRVRLDGRYHWVSVHTVREPEPAITIPDADAPDKLGRKPAARVDQGSSGAIDIG